MEYQDRFKDTEQTELIAQNVSLGSAAMAIKIHIVTHCWNEELLMPGWVKWHKALNPDSVTVIDHYSTDRTVGIIKELAPDWNIIPTRLEWFAAGPLDHEVSEVEASLPTSPEDWKITLNTTEYLWTPSLRERLQLASQQAPHLQAFGARSVSLVDLEPNDSLDPAEHITGYIDYERGVHGARRWRYIHNQDYGHYHLGRHGVDLPATEMPDWFILHWHFAPFPLCKNRKQSINSRRPPGDVALGLGVQHGAVSTDEGFQRVYEEERARSFNLLDFPLYREYYEAWRQRRENEIRKRHSV